MLQLKLSRRHCAVVEKAESAREIAVRMMARRPAKGIGCIFTVHDELGSCGGDIGRRAGGSPRAGTDRTRRVDGVPAKTTDDVGRVRGGVAHRMHVGDHFGACIAKRTPSVPRLLQEAKIFGAVNPGPRPLTENGRRDQIVLASFQPRQQTIGALRLLGGALDDAAHQKELRIVAAVQFGVDGLHAGTPLVGDRIPLGAAPASLLAGVSSRTSLPTSRQA